MKNYRDSFTLIELLVTVSFILLFSGLSVGYYTQYSESKKLENAGRRISTALNLVRQLTISGNSSMCIPAPLTTPAAAYHAFVVKSETSYSIEPVCNSGTPQPATYKNETNILFVTPLPPTPPLPVVTFFPVTGTSVCNYIYLQNRTLSGAKKCRYVKISQTGAVSDSPCNDCTSCPTSCP